MRQNVVFTLLLGTVLANVAVADRIHELTARGDTKAIQELLAVSPEQLQAADASGRTPLHIAAREGFRELVTLFLNKGAKIDAQTSYGSTPLVSAIHGDKTEVALLLITKGADLTLTYKDNLNTTGNTALHAAAYQRNGRVMRALLEKRVDPNVLSDKEATPLHMLLSNLPRHDVKDADVKVLVAILLNAKADANKSDKNGVSPLHEAVRCNYYETALALIGAGADVNAESEAKVKPLHIAVKKGDPKMIKLLKDKGATEAPKE